MGVSNVTSTASALGISPRPDLQFQACHYDGQRYWRVKDPVTLRYFQFRDEEYFLWRNLDQATDLDDLCQRFQDRYRPRQLTVRELTEFLAMLHRDGLIIADRPGQGATLLERAHRQRRRERNSRLSNPLAIRIRGVHPGRFLDGMYRASRWFFHWQWLAVAGLLWILAAALVVVSGDRFLARLPELGSLLSPSNWLLFAATLSLAKIVHELAHALTCKHYGGECHEMGVMFLVFTPCLYCNVSDSWMLPDKRQRIAVTAAGVIADLTLAALATLAWYWSQPGWIQLLCLNMMIVGSVGTILFNGNPLMRFDGYYLLCDALDIPNLWQQSRAWWRERLGHWCLGLPKRRHRQWSWPAPAWKRVVVVAYGLLSMIYVLLVMAGIVWAVRFALQPYGLQTLAYWLAAFLTVALLAPMVYQAIRQISSPVRRREIRRAPLLSSLALVLILIATIGFWPLPSTLDAPAYLDAEGAKPVYVTVAGRLLSAVEPAHVVDAHQPLATLANYRLDLELLRLEDDLSRYQLAVEQLRREAISNAEMALTLKAAEQRVQQTRQQLQLRTADRRRLTLVSPAAGVVLPPRPRTETNREGRLPQWTGTPLDRDNRGCYLEVGTLLCRVGDPTRRQAVVLVREDQVQLLRVGQPVQLALQHGPRLEGTLAEISRHAVQAVPGFLDRRSWPTVIEDGQHRPLVAVYEAIVQLPASHGPLLLDAQGRAEITIDRRTLAARVYRWFRTVW